MCLETEAWNKGFWGFISDTDIHVLDRRDKMMEIYIKKMNSAFIGLFLVLLVPADFQK